MRAPSSILATFLIFASLGAPSFAASKLLSTVNLKGTEFRIHAELYFDAEKKQPDLFIDFEQTTGDKKVAFKSTSIPARFKDADIKLVPMPLAELEGAISLIYDGYELKTGYYDGSRGVALLVRYPISFLEDSAELVRKNFPKSIAKTAAGQEYVKAVLCMIISGIVYPVAAFDVEPQLGQSPVAPVPISPLVVPH